MYNERASQPTMPEPRLTKLPRNGPKPGQSTAAWLYGKDKNCQAERDAAKWKEGKWWDHGKPWSLLSFSSASPISSPLLRENN